MHIMKIKRSIALVVLLTVTGLAPDSIPAAPTGNHNSPDLPSPLCNSLQPPAGNRVAGHAYALGVQIYRWNGTSWVFVEPEATLFDDAIYQKKVGIHYAGPTWESNGGSKVTAARQADCTPNSTAIPWLLLKTVTKDGPGVFGATTYIQRVNTRGGLTPTAPGRSIGAIAEVPYTAEYYFYRVQLDPLAEPVEPRRPELIPVEREEQF
jgi:hypothetical protein